MNRTNGEAEVAKQTLTVDEHEGARNVHLLGGKGVDVQPTVEALVAGLKLAELMVGAEPLDAATVHASGSFG